jgi:hypothetical protein
MQAALKVCRSQSNDVELSCWMRPWLAQVVRSMIPAEEQVATPAG